MECAETLVIDVICSLRDCEKYAQHLIWNLKDTRTGLALLPEAHIRLKLEFFVFFVGNFAFSHWTAVIYSVGSSSRDFEFFALSPGYKENEKD